MDNVARWALIIGFLMPLLVAVIEQPKWPDWARAVVAAILCIIAGCVQVYVMGQFNPADLYGQFARVLGGCVDMWGILSTRRSHLSMTGGVPCRQNSNINPVKSLDI